MDQETTEKTNSPVLRLPEILNKVRARTPARLLSARAGRPIERTLNGAARGARAARDAVRAELIFSPISARTSCKSGISLEVSPGHEQR